MLTRKFICVILALTFLLSFCSTETAESPASSTEKTHLGGAILIAPVGEVPGDLYMNSGVVPTDEYPPFTKKLTVYGLTLIARDDISDDFMNNVAKTIIEMFPRGGDIDGDLQEELIRNMYKYRTTIPLYQRERREMSPEDRAAWSATRNQNSVCDIIMDGEVGRQIMEVVEHILHHVTDVGLHYTFPDEWAVTSGSKLHQLMLEAVEKGYYDDTSYDRIEDAETRLRVKLQELAYIVITTAWDLQEPYGGGGDEWTQGGTIVNGDDMKTQFSEMYQLYEETVAKVMVAPNRSLLDELFGS